MRKVMGWIVGILLMLAWYKEHMAVQGSGLQVLAMYSIPLLTIVLLTLALKSIKSK